MTLLALLVSACTEQDSTEARQANRVQVRPGSTVDLGRRSYGSSKKQTFVLFNPGNAGVELVLIYKSCTFDEPSTAELSIAAQGSTSVEFGIAPGKVGDVVAEVVYADVSFLDCRTSTVVPEEAQVRLLLRASVLPKPVAIPPRISFVLDRSASGGRVPSECIVAAYEFIRVPGNVAPLCVEEAPGWLEISLSHDKCHKVQEGLFRRLTSVLLRVNERSEPATGWGVVSLINGLGERIRIQTEVTRKAQWEVRPSLVIVGKTGRYKRSVNLRGCNCSGLKVQRVTSSCEEGVRILNCSTRDLGLLGGQKLGFELESNLSTDSETTVLLTLQCECGLSEATFSVLAFSGLE